MVKSLNQWDVLIIFSQCLRLMAIFFLFHPWACTKRVQLNTSPRCLSQKDCSSQSLLMNECAPTSSEILSDPLSYLPFISSACFCWKDLRSRSPSHVLPPSSSLLPTLIVPCFTFDLRSMPYIWKFDLIIDGRVMEQKWETPEENRGAKITGLEIWPQCYMFSGRSRQFG